MIIDTKTKHNKYESDWKTTIKRLSSVLTAEEQKNLTKLNDELTTVHTEQTKIKTEIKNLEAKKTGLADIAGSVRRVNSQLTDLENNYNSAAKQKEKSRFLGNATGQYDWETKIKAYHPLTYSDNLYEGTVNGTKIKITEQEAIKLLTRVIKAFEKINQSKFATKFTASTHTTGTNHLPEIQKLASDGLKDNLIIGKDAQGQDLPDKGKPANHQHLDRIEYAFKSQFVDDGDIQKTPSATAFTPQSTETITKAKVDNFFAFITAISKDGTIKPPFLTELKSDSDILKDIENNITWKILPAQSTPLADSKLADYGITVTNSNNTKLYLSETHDKAVKFQITEGLKSWIELVQAFFSEASQQTKLSSSFATDPYNQLLTDIGNNTHSAIWELPESLTDLQAIADQLELDKMSAATTNAKLTDEINLKNSELTTKDSEITTKSSELSPLLQKIITKKREELNQFNLQGFDNQTASGGQDNRKTVSELWKLQNLLSEIRYLENDGDATANSSVAEENTALTTVRDIFTKANSLWQQSHWTSIGWKEGASEEENYNRPNSEKIKLIQEKKDHNYVGGLTHYHDQLVELEKIVKLTEQETQIKADLKAAIDKKSPSENLQEWRDTLKTLDPLLESAFTDEKIAQWKEKKSGQAKFDNTASIKSLLEKVKDDTKFLTFIKNKDSQTDTLSKLIEKKDPAEVIKLITYWTEYEKLSDDEKKKKKQQLVWTLEKKDKDGKYLEDGDLTETEIINTLYEIAIGKKTLASQKKADSSETPTDPGNKEKLNSWWKFGKGNVAKPLFTYFTILAVIFGIAMVIFWEKISKWVKGPEDLGGEIESKEEKEGDD